MKNLIINKAVKLASDTLNIPVPKIRLTDEKAMINNKVPCIFSKEKYLLIFNNNWIDTASEIELVIICFHEVRHAYQYYSILNIVNEKQEILNAWDSNFNNYIHPTDTMNEEKDIEYLTQPIEKDAILWTHHMIKEIFGVSTVLPNILK